MSPLERFKKPDKKNAQSLIEASKREIEFTLKIESSEESATTIIRNKRHRKPRPSQTNKGASKTKSKHLEANRNNRKSKAAQT